MKYVGVAFGAVIAVLFFGISLAMVWQYGMSRSDTDIAGRTMAAFGVVAIFYSMGGFTFSRFLKNGGRDELANIILAGLIAAEGCIIFCELGFHGLNIKSTELKREAQSITVGVNLDQVENARRVIKELRDVPPSAEIEANIKVELARIVKDRWDNKRPLSILANGCDDEKNPYYGECEKVLKLRADLPRAKKFESAQMQVSTTTTDTITEKAPVNAGAEVGADMTGWRTEALSHAQLWFMLGFLAIGRLTTVPVIAMCLSAKKENKTELLPVPLPAPPPVVTVNLSQLPQTAVAAVEASEKPKAIRARQAQKRLAPPQSAIADVEPRIVLNILRDLIDEDRRVYYSEAEALLRNKFDNLSPQKIGRMLAQIGTRSEKRVMRNGRREYYYEVRAA